MTFLNVLFLAALPLIAVPVFIHLYRGRQRDVIPWAAMEFLAQAVTKGRSMERFEEIVLMAMRVGVVAALVLALAQPMVRSSWWGSSGNQEVLLVLDNSLSMCHEVDSVSAHDRLIDEAEAIIEALSGSDEVHLLLAAGGLHWLTAEGVPADSAGKRQLRAALETVEPTLGAVNLLDCLQRVVNLETVGEPLSRRIVVLTDNQARSWQTEAETSWQQLGAARSQAEAPTSIEVVNCSLATEELDNLAIMEIKVSRFRARPDEVIELAATVTNLGTRHNDPSGVQWLIDGEVFATSDLPPLRAQQSAQVTAELTNENPGNYVVTCRMEATDQVPLDQEGSVVIQISDQVPVLLVHNGEAGALTKPVDELFTAALGYDDGRPQPWHSAYQPEVVLSEQLSDITLSRYAAVVLAGVDGLDEEMVDRLSAFVHGGGGLWVTLGYGLNRQLFNRQWYDDGDGLSPLELDVLTKVDDMESPAGAIHPPSREHPATAQLASTTQLDIDEARLSEYWQLARSAASREVSILLESGSGSPLVVENYVGRGRVLIQAFPLDLEWSNLPQLKAYVVMINDWLDYLTAPSTARYNLAPGDAIVVSVQGGDDLQGATLLTPSGRSRSVTLQPLGDASTLRYSQTQLPGLYRVILEDGEPANFPFHVLSDAGESHLTMLDAQQQDKLAEWAGLQLDGKPTAATTTIASAARTEPVWGAFLLLLVALLAGELLLSNWLARQRSGVAIHTT
ncbi:MAG: BatA domain-containing protein [Pirellulales bacterium]|nr:BatA domain-containing protein [Pirellulales bacterium]